MDLISIIVPCFNEEKALPYFWSELQNIMQKMEYCSFEIIFVDDGSSDHTAEKIVSLASSDSKVKYIVFSRNFGKEAAIFAGFEHAKGNYVAMMDADLKESLRLRGFRWLLHLLQDFCFVYSQQLPQYSLWSDVFSLGIRFPAGLRLCASLFSSAAFSCFLWAYLASI